MEIVGRLYEMDVVYTLEKDYFDKIDAAKAQQLNFENKFKLEREKEHLNREKETIHRAILIFYEDLMNYEIDKINAEYN